MGWCEAWPGEECGHHGDLRTASGEPGPLGSCGQREAQEETPGERTGGEVGCAGSTLWKLSDFSQVLCCAGVCEAVSLGVLEL